MTLVRLFLFLIVFLFVVLQAGPNPWAIENFAAVAKYPSAQIVAQVC